MVCYNEKEERRLRVEHILTRKAGTSAPEEVTTERAVEPIHPREEGEKARSSETDLDFELILSPFHTSREIL